MTDNISRALELGSYFLSGALAINISQVLGAPLSWINTDWYNSWIAFTKQSFGILMMAITQRWAPTTVRVSGDASMRGQLFESTDNKLLCNFQRRMILIANHQIYTDWLYLWWIAYTNEMHGRLYIILKESLKNIPVIGWGMQLSQFIFLKRNWEQDKPQMAKHLTKLNNPKDPMWLMLFPEGTNLASDTRAKSKAWAEKNNLKDFNHVLHPRTTGLQFCLQQLSKTVGYVYDCTIAYEGVKRGEYAQDIYTLRASYVQGKPPKAIHMYWRRYLVSEIPIHNDVKFARWLRARWKEKDMLLEIFHLKGEFPADTGVEVKDGQTRRGTGYINTRVEPNNLYEFLQVFMPMGVLASVLSMFYGDLPKFFMNQINKQALAFANNQAPPPPGKLPSAGKGNLPVANKVGVKRATGASTPAHNVNTASQTTNAKTSTPTPAKTPTKAPPTRRASFAGGTATPRSVAFKNDWPLSNPPRTTGSKSTAVTTGTRTPAATAGIKTPGVTSTAKSVSGAKSGAATPARPLAASKPPGVNNVASRTTAAKTAPRSTAPTKPASQPVKPATATPKTTKSTAAAPKVASQTAKKPAVATVKSPSPSAKKPGTANTQTAKPPATVKKT